MGNLEVKVQKLTKLNTDLKQQYDQLTKIHSKFVSDIGMKNVEINNKDEKIKNLMNEASKKSLEQNNNDSRIKELLSEASMKTVELTNQDKRIKVLIADALDKSNVLIDKEAKIKQLIDESSRHKSELDRLNSNGVKKDDQISALKKFIDDKMKKEKEKDKVREEKDANQRELIKRKDAQ